MIVRVGTAPRAPGLGYTAFQKYWRGEHARLAAGLPGLRGHVQNHALIEQERPLLPYPGFDACSELEFESLEAMDEAFASEHYRRTVVADEHQLVDKTRLALLLAERRVLTGGEPGGDAVKLLTFLPLDPRASHACLAEVLAGPYRQAVAAARPLRHEQLVQIPGGHEGRRPALCAAVDVLWFRAPGDALEAVVGDVGHRAAYELAGVAFGTARLLARPLRIV